jgi:hypothetical protein
MYFLLYYIEINTIFWPDDSVHLYVYVHVQAWTCTHVCT